MTAMKFSEKEMEKTAKENDDSKRRTFFMIVFSSMLNFVTKVPLIITSLNDLRLLILTPSQCSDLTGYDLTINTFDFIKVSVSFRFFCHTQNSCVTFQNVSNLLFLFSLSSVLFFLKGFDKNFKAAYQMAFSKLGSNAKKKT